MHVHHPQTASLRERLFGLALLCAAPLAACSAEGLDGGDESVGSDEQAVVGGTDTWDRPEVVELELLGGFAGIEGGRCSATMISSTTFVTAAHCINYLPSAITPARVHLTRGPNAGDEIIQDVRGLYSLGNKGPDSRDLAVGFLRVPMPRGWDWSAPIHYREFPSALWTKMGYGCTSRSGQPGAGVRRFRESSGTSSKFNCPGDSGGPLFAGGLYAQGGVAMVNSGYNSSGNDVDAWVDPVWVEGMQREFSAPERGRGYELGVDRPGFDYRTIQNIDGGPCRNECLADPRCQAFTITFNGRGGSTCFLKSVAASADPVPADILSGVSEGYGTFDLPGGDLYVRTEPNVESCEAYCARTSNCKAYSQTNAGQCWIKDRANPIVASTTVQSGKRRNLEIGVDRPGMDYRSFPASNAGSCQSACAADKLCDAFSYSYTDSKCWLKQGIPPAVGNATVTSGLRRGIEFSARRTGHVFREFDLGNEPMRRCQTECTADVSCVAWTAALPSGATNGKRPCQLMDTVGTRESAVGKISGRKGLDFF